jgi:hypothetical protein
MKIDLIKHNQLSHLTRYFIKIWFALNQIQNVIVLNFKKKNYSNNSTFY